MDYQIILNMFTEIMQVAFPIAIIGNLVVSLACIMLDFIFPRKRGGF